MLPLLSWNSLSKVGWSALASQVLGLKVCSATPSGLCLSGGLNGRIGNGTVRCGLAVVGVASLEEVSH